MFRLVGIFLVVAIAAASYFLVFEDSVLPSADLAPLTQQQNTAPIAATEPTKVEEVVPAPLVLPKLTSSEKKQAQAHVKSITSSASQPIEITSADHFVTADQLLQLPELAPLIAKLESPTQNPALIVSAPNTATANLNDVQKNAENATVAQSFAVKIPSFKKVDKLAIKTEQQPTTEQNKTVIEVIAVQSSANQISNDQSVITADPVSNAQTKPKIIEVIVKSQTPPKQTSTVEKPATIEQTVTVAKQNPASQINSAPSITIVDNLANQDQLISPSTSEEIPTSLFNTLKKNLEELSDIKVSELAALVSDNIISVQDPKPTAQMTLKAESATKPIQTQAPASTATTPIVAPKPTITAQQTKDLSKDNRITLRELLSETESDQKRIFYLHAVNVSDEQGIWGIIQQGLMGTFSKGITLAQANGEVRALIPQDADEMLSSKKSSFLGRLLNYKVLTTYVYNYEQGYIGKNPDIIKPGQQLIIVTFTEDELMSVYQHFKELH